MPLWILRGARMNELCLSCNTKQVSPKPFNLLIPRRRSSYETSSPLPPFIKHHKPLISQIHSPLSPLMAINNGQFRLNGKRDRRLFVQDYNCYIWERLYTLKTYQYNGVQRTSIVWMVPVKMPKWIRPWHTKFSFFDGLTPSQCCIFGIDTKKTFFEIFSSEFCIQGISNAKSTLLAKLHLWRTNSSTKWSSWSS